MSQATNSDTISCHTIVPDSSMESDLCKITFLIDENDNHVKVSKLVFKTKESIRPIVLTRKLCLPKSDLTQHCSIEITAG